MAIEKGSTKAMFNLAIIFDSEEKNIVEAKKWYLLAAEIGDTDVMFNLALLY